MATQTTSSAPGSVPLPRFWPESWRGAWGKRAAQAVFALVNGTFTTAVLALLAHWSESPVIFPSLGPTAFLFFHRPLAPAASPRNTLAGHAIALAVGWLSLAVMGLTQEPSTIAVGVTWPRIVATALSLGFTSGLMILLGLPHPPAAATTLVVSLGLIHEPWKYPLLMAGIVVLILQGLAINRLAGLPYPFWAPADPETRDRYRDFS